MSHSAYIYVPFMNTSPDCRCMSRGVIGEIQATHPNVADRLGILVDGSTPRHRRALDILARCLDVSSPPTNNDHDEFEASLSSNRSVDLDETKELSNTLLDCSASPVLLGSTLVADW